jgi:hypothetical protein
MIVYLAGFKTIEKTWNEPTNDIHLLSSFWEHKNGKYGEYVTQEKHILDSGAFSALNGSVSKSFNFDEYVKKYIAFIKYTNQKLFFELDIDPIVGYEKVKYYTKKIEDAIGIQPIPVWHKSRGKEEWFRLCEEYNYVAIGGIVTREIKQKEYDIFIPLLKIAKERNTKVHGLGFTKSSLLHKYKFHSVDSTTWNVGGKFGNVVVFDKNNLPTQRYKADKTKKAKTNELNLYNFQQWVKFQKYAENNL